MVNFAYDPVDIVCTGTLVGRLRRPELAYPSIITVRDGEVFDITAATAPTVRDICELDDPAAYVSTAPGQACGPVAHLAKLGTLLAPVDLQVIKASGVTFVASMLERVIDEQTRGDPERAQTLRHEIQNRINMDLAQVKPGSSAAQDIKRLLLEQNAWSQYLEVGIGPDAEIFTKAPPLAAVGHMARVGINPISTWNNPEPEMTLVVSSAGRTVGATLGNDVNLRDVEGRSALLLGKAKDNNASCALGPFVRLFDDSFSMTDVRNAQISLHVVGLDGHILEGQSSMALISRDPAELVTATWGSFHQYPDGFALLLGTMFAPVADRDEPGRGFTHKTGDVVSISTPALGTLRNEVHPCEQCPPWNYAASHLMRELAAANML